MSDAFTNILSRDLAATKDFYMGLLGLCVAAEDEGFLNLRSPLRPATELGVWHRDNELVPPGFPLSPQGTILSFEVTDVDEVYARAVASRVTVLRPTRPLDAGRRGFLIADPNGVPVQVFQLTDGSMGDGSLADGSMVDGGVPRPRVAPRPRNPSGPRREPTDPLGG